MPLFTNIATISPEVQAAAKGRGPVDEAPYLELLQYAKDNGGVSFEYDPATEDVKQIKQGFEALCHRVGFPRIRWIETGTPNKLGFVPRAAPKPRAPRGSRKNKAEGVTVNAPVNGATASGQPEIEIEEIADLASV